MGGSRPFSGAVVKSAWCRHVRSGLEAVRKHRSEKTDRDLETGREPVEPTTDQVAHAICSKESYKILHNSVAHWKPTVDSPLQINSSAK